MKSLCQPTLFILNLLCKTGICSAHTRDRLEIGAQRGCMWFQTCEECLQLGLPPLEANVYLEVLQINRTSGHTALPWGHTSHSGSFLNYLQCKIWLLQVLLGALTSVLSLYVIVIESPLLGRFSDSHCLAGPWCQQLNTETEKPVVCLCILQLHGSRWFLQTNGKTEGLQIPQRGFLGSPPSPVARIPVLLIMSLCSQAQPCHKLLAGFWSLLWKSMFVWMYFTRHLFAPLYF